MYEGRWFVDVSGEVEKWYNTLGPSGKATADRVFDRLAEYGPALRMPHCRPLGGDLFELRFMCEDVHRRVTYYVDVPRMIITLTTFRKQRQKEHQEIRRARIAMKRDQWTRRIHGQP